MSTVPDTAELTMLRAGKTDWMQTSIVLCTKASTADSGGVTETLTEGATVLGRLYTRTQVQKLAGNSEGQAALVQVTSTYVELPMTAALHTFDAVRIGTLYYDVTHASQLDDHRQLSLVYQAARLGIET